MALSATSSTLSFASKAAAAQTTTVSGGTQPYSILVAPSASVATASIVGSTGVVTITPAGPGTATLTVKDSAGTPLTIVLTAKVTATIVQLNTRIVSGSLGCIQSDNASYWDPLTGVNLNRGNPISGALDSFTSVQLANIANAVASSVLKIVSGVLPASTATFNTYNTVFHNGPITGTAVTLGIGPAPDTHPADPADGSGYTAPVFTGGGSAYAGTGVAASDTFEPLNDAFGASTVNPLNPNANDVGSAVNAQPIE